MTQQSIDTLLDTLMNSSNDTWRDDAAQELANCPNKPQAEEALFTAIASSNLDDSLRRTCAESLATIWIRAGQVQDEKVRRLTGMPRIVVEEFLRTAQIRREN